MHCFGTVSVSTDIKREQLEEYGKVLFEIQKETEVLLSIIIPVYQVEEYLEQCLNSVLCCSLQDCEVLLSSGNSIDRSNEICYEYAKKFPFIQVIKQNGTGLSNARNSAMKMAKGKYFLFLDSDDYIIPENLNYILTQFRNGFFQSDVIAADFYELNCITQEVTNIFPIGKDDPIKMGIEFLPLILQKGQNYWSVWRYIYRRDFLEKNNLQFKENSMAEDVDFTTRVLLANPDIIFCHSPYYVYRVARKGSLMDGVTLKRFTDAAAVLKSSIQKVQESQLPYAKLLLDHLQRDYLYNLSFAIELPIQDHTSALLFYKDWKEVLKKPSNLVVRISMFSMYLFGIPITAYLLCWTRRLKHWIRKLIGRKKTAK